MTCEGIGQTLKGEKLMYFCTAILDPKDRIYSEDTEKVCPVGIDCKARKSAFQPLVDNPHSSTRGKTAAVNDCHGVENELL
jgi:hypothetical protein